jgi:hypothetical protein
MFTAETEVEPIVDDLDVDSEDDFEYVYPQEILEEWVRQAEIMKEQAARGEIKPQTVEEFAAEMGVDLD